MPSVPPLLRLRVLRSAWRTVLTLAITSAAQAQPPTAHRWRDAEAGVDIRFTSDAPGRLTGRIVALRDSVDASGQPARDTKNPDATLRTRPIVGLPMITGMRPASATEWTDGRIYDARSGKTYRASMRLAHPDTLRVRGFVQLGVVKIGRTASWTRLPEPARVP